jgi:hypothetical protein
MVRNIGPSVRAEKRAAMPKFEVKWSIKKTAIIEADSAKAAQAIAENQLDCETDGEYYEGSFDILEIEKIG